MTQTTNNLFTATVGGASKTVYGCSRLMESGEVTPTEEWAHGDTVEQSWIIVKGGTSSNVVLTLSSGAITSYNIYPENVATSVAINAGNLEFTVPANANLRVEVNGDRANCFHVFAGPASTRVKAGQTDWTTLVKTVQSIDSSTNTVNCTAHGFSNGDQVHLYSTGTLPEVANPGSLTNGPSSLFTQGPILSHSPAWVANATANSFTLVHRDLTTPVDFLTNGTGSFTVSPGEWADTTNALYFPSGTHHMGMQMVMADNTEVLIDEDAIVHGSFNLQQADGVLIHGGGMVTGEYRQRKELDSSAGFTQCIEHCTFIGNLQGGTSNGYPANKNGGDGQWDNEVRDITVFDNAFYIDNKGVWSWTNVAYINIWSYNADGFKTSPKSSADRRGQIVDCFTFASDDCCKFQVDSKNSLLDNVFAVAAANACFQGYSWPSDKADGYAAIIRDCHAMHLMGADNGLDEFEVGATFPFYGTRHIIRSYVDGYEAQTGEGHNNVTFRNLNVWGPCEVRLLSAGNYNYPFNQSQQRDQFGQMNNWVLEDVTVHTPPTVMSGSRARVHSKDKDNHPEDWFLINVVFGTTVVTETNKDTYFDFDDGQDVRNIRFIESGEHFTVGSGWVEFDYASVSDWLTARKVPSPARGTGDYEIATLMDSTHDFISDDWGGWSAAGGETNVILRPGYKHGGDWASGVTLTNTSTTFNNVSIFGGQQRFTIEIEDFVIDQGGLAQPLLRLQNNNTANTDPFTLTLRRCLGVPGNNGVVSENTNNSLASASQVFNFENCVLSSRGTSGKPLFSGAFSATNEANSTVNLTHCTIDETYVQGNRGGGDHDLTVNVRHCVIRENGANPGGTGFARAPVTGTLNGSSSYNFTDESEATHTAWSTTLPFKTSYDTQFVYNTRAKTPGVISFRGTGTQPKQDYALTSGGFNACLGAENDDPTVSSYNSSTTDDVLGAIRYNDDAGAYNGDDFQILGLERTADIDTGFTLRTGDFITVRDWGNQVNKRRTWNWGDGTSISTDATVGLGNDFYSHTHRYSTAGTYEVTLTDETNGKVSSSQTITVADPQALDVGITGAHTGGGNISYFLTEPVADQDWNNLSNVFVELEAPTSATSVEYDPGPGNTAWQSDRWGVRDLSTPLVPLYVYSHEEPIPSSISNQVWQSADTDVDQSWVSVWADGAVTFMVNMAGVAFDGLSEATSVVVYPKNVCSVGYSGGFALIKVPYNTKIRVEGATNRNNALHLFNSPPRTATPTGGEVTNWNDRVYTVSSVNNSGSATEFTVGGLDLTGYTNGDTFRVIYTNADTSTYPVNDGNTFDGICTNGSLSDFEIITATVVNNTNPGVIKLTDSASPSVDILLNTTANASNHQIGITDLVAANASDITYGAGDTNSVLYFPAGVHKIGRLFQVAGGNSNTQDVSIATRTIHMDPGAVVIGSLDFRRRDPANNYGLFTTNQGHGQGVTVQGGGHFTQLFATRSDLDNTNVRDYGAALGTSANTAYRSFENEGVGGLIANNTIKEITHFAQNFHHGKHGAAHYYDYKSLSPWHWNCDGPQIYRDGNVTAENPGGLGTMKHCFIYNGDDVCFLIRQGGDLEVSRSFFVSVANSAINGGYWATSQNNLDRYIHMNDCDILPLGATDSGKQQVSFWDIDHGTPATATIEVGGSPWLTFSAYPYDVGTVYASQHSFGANGNNWTFTVSSASNGDAGYFDLELSDGTRTENFYNIAGPAAINETSPTYDHERSPEQRIMSQSNSDFRGGTIAGNPATQDTADQTNKRSPYFLVSRDESITTGMPVNGIEAASGGADPAIGAGPQGISGPGIGSRSIFRCHSDGADNDLDSGCMRKQNNPYNDYFVASENVGNGSSVADGILVENIRVWGACTHRPFSIGNIRYPFWGNANPYGSRDSAGTTENVTLRNWTFEQEPAQQGVIQGLDATNKPSNITIENWNIAGERLDLANYDDYILVDGGSSTLTVGSSGTDVIIDADGSDPDIKQVSWSGDTPTVVSALTGVTEAHTIGTNTFTSYSATVRASGMNVAFSGSVQGGWANFFAAATASTDDGAQQVNVPGTSQSVTEQTLATATAVAAYAASASPSQEWTILPGSNAPYARLSGVGPAPRGPSTL